ncbi:MAG: DNA polymerase III subunit gamma/tau [Tepidisphaeraceae bacterium]|jgi:DNA polymerase-3 subunit gamma/tau
MSYTVLARRYRSKTFDEVVGQQQIAHTLAKAIETDRVAHAYLFCGARGTGKTSTARILAKCLNCLEKKAPTTKPCNKCDSCVAIARGEDIDVIEIDAASNTGVDNVRDIISNAQFRPARARFKVYIIDEVHMLSKNAFNALLKILEEPPSHVKFILATTEPEKVLATILSRCQRYDFRNISTAEIAGHLAAICKDEKIPADTDALMLVAKSAAGSMRDGLSLLERLLSAGESKLTVQIVEQLIGLPKSQEIFDLADAIGRGDVRQTLERASAMLAAGMSADALVSALGEHLRNLLIVRTCGADSGLIEVAAAGLAELKKQADQFDSIALTQDIPILEELRRQLRQGYGGRPLLDATLVRLALAEQFASIGDLMGRLDSGAGPAGAAAPAQKKNFDAPINGEGLKDESPGSVTPPRSYDPPPARAPAMAFAPVKPVLASVPPASRDAQPAPAAVARPMNSRPAAPAASEPPARLTPELTAEVEKDPLVRAVIAELDGRVVKVD